MNPFLLAALVFGAIGLVQEAMDAKEKEVKPAKPAKPKAIAAPAPGPQTIVNVGAEKKATVEKKAAKKVAPEPKPSDG